MRLTTNVSFSIGVHEFSSFGFQLTLAQCHSKMASRHWTLFMCGQSKRASPRESAESCGWWPNFTASLQLAVETPPKVLTSVRVPTIPLSAELLRRPDEKP